MASELLTLPEVARHLHVSLDEALALVESQTIPAGRGEDGGVYVRRSDLDAYQARKATA
ncbi:MAG TPA: helix-turn-helix domain-containing protein [Acidimicrobiia bacterium]|jgi:succinyl-CoA synthetase beta subunit|nr:helix-turn-helix domain-containing protein [Acidimicrobiia bacterium]